MPKAPSTKPPLKGTPGYPASSRSIFVDSEMDDLSGNRQRQVIGYLGAALPFAVCGIHGLWHASASGSPDGSLLSSISAYFYTSAVAFFVGMLSVLALNLFTYQGYRNAYRRIDRIMAITSSVAALGVAWCPTKATDGLVAPPWWSDGMDVWHFRSAALLFVSFIVFALFLFPRRGPRRRTWSKQKIGHNLIYVSCGLAMIACMIWVLIAREKEQSIFWPESIALESFALCWLTKGRAGKTLVRFTPVAWHYAKNPRKLRQLIWENLGP